MRKSDLLVVSVALLAIVVGGCQEPQAADEPEPEAVSDAPDRLPAGWDLADLAREALREEEWRGVPPVRPDVTRVLAWLARESDQQFYVETCIVWLRWQDQGVTWWRLAHLFRHPRRADTGWSLASTDHVPRPGERTFDHPPTNPEVYQFLADTWWDFRPEPPDLVIRDAGVCVRAWREVIGQDPERFFDPKDITPRQVDSGIGPAPRDVTGRRRADSDTRKVAELPPAGPPIGPAPRVVRVKREQ